MGIAEPARGKMGVSLAKVLAGVLFGAAKCHRHEHLLDTTLALHVDGVKKKPQRLVLRHLVVKKLDSGIDGRLAAGACRRFVCTIKFQGAADHAVAARFAAIPGSELRHLYHNRHELTWIKLG
jgi:hypothetical protein